MCISKLVLFGTSKKNRVCACSLDALKQCWDLHLQLSMRVVCPGADQVSCLDCLLGGLQIFQEHSTRLGRDCTREMTPRRLQRTSHTHSREHKEPCSLMYTSHCRTSTHSHEHKEPWSLTLHTAGLAPTLMNTRSHGASHFTLQAPLQPISTLLNTRSHGASHFMLQAALRLKPTLLTSVRLHGPSVFRRV